MLPSNEDEDGDMQGASYVNAHMPGYAFNATDFYAAISCGAAEASTIIDLFPEEVLELHRGLHKTDVLWLALTFFKPATFDRILHSTKVWSRRYGAYTKEELDWTLSRWFIESIRTDNCSNVFRVLAKTACAFSTQKGGAYAWDVEVTFPLCAEHQQPYCLFCSADKVQELTRLLEGLATVMNMSCVHYFVQRMSLTPVSLKVLLFRACKVGNWLIIRWIIDRSPAMRRELIKELCEYTVSSGRHTLWYKDSGFKGATLTTLSLKSTAQLLSLFTSLVPLSRKGLIALLGELPLVKMGPLYKQIALKVYPQRDVVDSRDQLCWRSMGSGVLARLLGDGDLAHYIEYARFFRRSDIFDLHLVNSFMLTRGAVGVYLLAKADARYAIDNTYRIPGLERFTVPKKMSDPKTSLPLALAALASPLMTASKLPYRQEAHRLASQRIRMQIALVKALCAIYLKDCPDGVRGVAATVINNIDMRTEIFKHLGVESAVVAGKLAPVTSTREAWQLWRAQAVVAKPHKVSWAEMDRRAAMREAIYDKKRWGNQLACIPQTGADGSGETADIRARTVRKLAEATARCESIGTKRIPFPPEELAARANERAVLNATPGLRKYNEQLMAASLKRKREEAEERSKDRE